MNDKIKKQEAVVAEALARNWQLALEAETLWETWSNARTNEQKSYEAWKTECLLLRRMREGQQ